MVNEYINKLKRVNDDKLLQYQKELSELVEEKETLIQSISALEAQKNTDINIFSPRGNKSNIDSMMKDHMKRLDQLNYDIEYIKSMLETHLQKKEEYEQLADEVNERKNQETEIDSGENSGAKEKYNSDSDARNVKNHLFQTFEEKEPVLLKLNELYKKVDLCLSLVQEKDSICEAELKNMKNIISEISKMI